MHVCIRGSSWEKSENFPLKPLGNHRRKALHPVHTFLVNISHTKPSQTSLAHILKKNTRLRPRLELRALSVVILVSVCSKSLARLQYQDQLWITLAPKVSLTQHITTSKRFYQFLRNTMLRILSYIWR